MEHYYLCARLEVLISDRSHAPRGHATLDALRPPEALRIPHSDAERHGLGSHAERGSHQLLEDSGKESSNHTPPTDLIIPTLRVGMQPSTLCVHLRLYTHTPCSDAERRRLGPHAERGSHQGTERPPRISANRFTDESNGPQSLRHHRI